MQHAVSKRGVAVIVLPGDIAAMKLPLDSLSRSIAAVSPLVRPCDGDVARLADLLNEAEKITLFCGIGCAGAHNEVVALAEKLQAPVGYSFRGKDWIEPDNPHAVGMTGLLGWGRRLRGDARLRRTGPLLGSDFPYERFLANVPEDRTGRYPSRTLGTVPQSSTWGSAVMSARRSKPSCRC